VSDAVQMTTPAPRPTRALQVIGLLALAALGLTARIWLLGRSSAAMNSDEFFTGQQAMAILEGDRPIIYRGIGYTAVIDSYLLAPIYWFADAPITALKLFNAPWWALTAIFSALTVRRSISNTDTESGRLHTVVGSLVWLTPGALLIVSTRSYEAYGLLLLGIAVTHYLAVRSIETAGTDQRWSYALGFTAGFISVGHRVAK